MCIRPGTTNGMKKQRDSTLFNKQMTSSSTMSRKGILRRVFIRMSWKISTISIWTCSLTRVCLMIEPTQTNIIQLWRRISVLRPSLVSSRLTSPRSNMSSLLCRGTRTHWSRSISRRTSLSSQRLRPNRSFVSIEMSEHYGRHPILLSQTPLASKSKKMLRPWTRISTLPRPNLTSRVLVAIWLRKCRSTKWQLLNRSHQ